MINVKHGIKNYIYIYIYYIYIYILYIYIYIIYDVTLMWYWGHVITCARFRLKQMWKPTNSMTEMKRANWTKRWNWSTCTKLALSVSWAAGLIAESVRASELNSVLVSSNLTQANFLELLLRILQWWIPYVSVHFTALIWLPVQDLALKQMWQLTKDRAEMRCDHWKK